MKSVSSANLPGLRKDIALYTEIRHIIDELTDVLRNMNGLTATMHRESGFADLIKAVMEKLAE